MLLKSAWRAIAKISNSHEQMRARYEKVLTCIRDEQHRRGEGDPIETVKLVSALRAAPESNPKVGEP
jgi:hypothetical protein